MARKHMTGEHKKGFFNATFGNFMRGGLLGAVVATAITVATGGLALLPMAAAAIGGGMALGSLNATWGGARWTGETIRNAVKGVFGFGRQGDQPGVEQAQQQGGMGFAEGVVTLIGAAMGIQSMKDKLQGVFGGKGQGNEPQQNDVSSPSQGGAAPSAQSQTVASQNPAVQADRLLAQYRDENGVYNMSAEDLAKPEVRKALEVRADWMREFRDRGGVDVKEEVNRLSRVEVDTQDPTNIAITDQQLLNGANRDELFDLGKQTERAYSGIDKTIGKQEKDINRLLEREARAIEKGDLDKADSLHDQVEQAKAQLQSVMGQRDEVVQAPTPAQPERTIEEMVQQQRDEGRGMPDEIAANLQGSLADRAHENTQQQEAASPADGSVGSPLDAPSQGREDAPQQRPSERIEEHESGLLIAGSNVNLHEVARAAQGVTIGEKGVGGVFVQGNSAGRNADHAQARHQERRESTGPGNPS